MPECEIVELHHDRKIDAPSGTAKRTADLIREAGGNVHEPIHSVRLPSFVVTTEIVFSGTGERLIMRHDPGESPDPYVAGTLLAIRRAADVPGVAAELELHHVRGGVPQDIDALVDTIAELRAWLLETQKMSASTGLMHKTLAALDLTYKKGSITRPSRRGRRSASAPSRTR